MQRLSALLRLITTTSFNTYHLHAVYTLIRASRERTPIDTAECKWRSKLGALSNILRFLAGIGHFGLGQNIAGRFIHVQRILLYLASHIKFSSERIPDTAMLTIENALLTRVKND
jgi:hypothetical protein